MRRVFLRSILAAGAFFALGNATTAFAQLPLPTPTPPPITLPPPVTVTLSIFGNEAVGSFDIDGIGADLRIAFHNVVGLTPQALDVTATLVNPLDPALLGRLPGSGVCVPPTAGAACVPVGFPVLIRISPSASSRLSFEGIYIISLHTHNLHLDPNVPFSLLKSPDGGPFKDITKSEGRGSYRDDGSGGDFSEFLIVVDFRDIDSVIAGKFDDLQALLTNNADSISPDVLATLQSNLSDARTLYQSGAIRQAIVAMTVFSRYVKAHSGEDIPDVWRANCSPLINVAGLLRSGAETLRFSLDRKLGR
jgi:hypothetical protein